MSFEKARLGSHCPQILGYDGRPTLSLPPNWQGLQIEETIVPGDAECGPQYAGVPILSFCLSGEVKRWYRSGVTTRVFDNGAPGFDIYGQTFERDFGKWKGVEGASLRLQLHPETIQRYLPDQALTFDLETRFALIDKPLREMVLILASELKNNQPNGLLFAEGVSMSILGWLHQHYAIKRSLPHKEHRLSNRHKNQITDFITTSLGSELTVEKMAHEVGISPGHFAVLFRRTFSLTPHQYVLKKRTEKAAELLRAKPELSISEVAMATGFSSQAHLTYTFKRYLQQTPARWKSSK